jgi:hydroxyacylglutathione hydrolase
VFDPKMLPMAKLEIEPVPCLKDNYAYLLDDRDEGVCGVVDASEAEPVKRALETHGLKLTHILSTHHHMDHVGGNLALKQAYGAQVVGAAKDAARIPGIDIGLKEGETFGVGSHLARVLEIPAHTSQHIAFWFEADKAVFTGDTLFAMGCGRLFEGTADMMWTSLSKLMRLPDDARIYCGHEYTEANGRFALTVEPDNPELRRRMEDVRQTRSKGLPTIPSTMGLEKKTNPFLRAESAEIRRNLGLLDANNVEVFAETRRRKDEF